MTRFLRSAAVVGLGLGLVGCAGQDEPAPFQSEGGGQEELLARLEADTGVTWNLVQAAGGASPRLLAPIGVPRMEGASPSEQARAFFARYGSALGAKGVAQELGAERIELLPDGATIVAYAMLIPGTNHPIFEASSGLRVGPAGAVDFVEAGFGYDFSATERGVAIPEQAATEAARIATIAQCSGQGNVNVHEVALGGHVGLNGKVVLAYRVDFASTGHCIAPRTFVDATTGTVSPVLDRAPSLIDRSKGGSYYEWDNAKDIKELDVSPVPGGFEMRTMGPGPIVSTRLFWAQKPVQMTSLGQWDTLDRGLSVDAHVHAKRGVDFFQNVHGWRGMDGRGANLDVVVHDPLMRHTGYYNPLTRSIHFGDGDTVKFQGPAGQNIQVRTLPFQLGYDGVVHELAHGVVASTSNLVYVGESGAINESFADVMGVSAKLLDPATAPGATLAVADVAFAGRIGGRNMLNPEADGFSISNYRKVPPCIFPSAANDFCFAHSSSGVGNRAFAMMIAGGQEVVASGETIAIPASISVYEANRIWFDSITSLRNPYAGYRMAAVAQVGMAYSRGAQALAAVACAWAAVEVLTPAEVLRWGVACKSVRSIPRRSSCLGVADGAYVCNDFAPSSASRCRGGVIASGVSCRNPKHRCLQPSVATFLATPDASYGGIQCQ